MIYGLALSGLIEREFWQNAFRTGAAKIPEKPAAPVAVAPRAPVGAPEPTDNRWTTADTEETELEEFLRRLGQAVNYYEVMQLPTTAHADEIKNAYYALARRYHPDRFHLKAGTPLHAKDQLRLRAHYAGVRDVDRRERAHRLRSSDGARATICEDDRETRGLGTGEGIRFGNR